MTNEAMTTDAVTTDALQTHEAPLTHDAIPGVPTRTPGIAVGTRFRFDALLVLGLTFYEVAASMIAATPIREAMRAVTRGHPDGERALLFNGAQRLVQAAITRTLPVPLLTTVLVVYLALLLVISPFVTGVVTGRIAYVDQADPRARAKLPSLFYLATRHYHEIAGATVVELVAKALAAGLAFLLGMVLMGTAHTDRGKGIVAVAVAVFGVLLVSVVAALFDALRTAILVREGGIGAAISTVRSLPKKTWLKLASAFAVRTTASFACTAGLVALSSTAKSGMGVLLWGELPLFVRTIVYVVWLYALTRAVRAPSER